MINQAYLKTFTNLNLDRDGIAEINKLKLMSFEKDNEQIPLHSKLVIVLVEPRLLETLSQGQSVRDVTRRLQRLKEDLWLEGYPSRFIEADIYAGAQHQDGRSVLAIRTFFQRIRWRFPNFQGAIIIGSFPEAMLVRRWIWKKENAKLTVRGREYEKIDYLRIVPEIVSDRSDIVLEDLNGNWQWIYEQRPKALDSIEAIPDTSMGSNWPVDGGTFTSSVFNKTTKTYQDFFWVRDDDFTILEERPGRLSLRVSTRHRHPELNRADRRLPNPIARPDIHVSRINPRHIAENPDPDYRDVHGRGLLAADGKPQEIEAATPFDPNRRKNRDPALERELIIDFLDRNHAYRSGRLKSIRFRPASIAYPRRQFRASAVNAFLDVASNDFDKAVAFENGSLLDYIKFLKTPAILKGVHAHSSAWNSAFSDNYRVVSLENAVGGRPWRWRCIGTSNRYRPSLSEQGPRADLYLHRTIYENKVLSNSHNCFYFHMGCKVNTPGGASTLPYSDEAYGGFQNAEGILFYLKGLALISRAKVFYDFPRGFPAAFGRTSTSCFGDGLSAYFDIEAQDSNLGAFEHAASSKRAYNWSVIGDWTLRLQYARIREDCIAFQTNNVRIQEEVIKLGFFKISRWLVTEGRNRMVVCPTRAEAERIVQIIKYYRLNKQCFVGRPDASMQYWLSSRRAPAGALAGEDAIPFDLYNLSFFKSGKLYIVTDGRSRMLGCPNEQEAQAAIYLLRKYRFTRQCYAGRPDPSMEYFRK